MPAQQAFSVVVNIGAAIDASVRTTLGAVQRQFRQMDTQLGALRQANAARLAGYQGQIVGMVGLGTALYGLIEPAVAFEAAMDRVGAVSRASAEDQAALAAQARALGASTRYSATEAAGAMQFLAMAGFDTNAILAATPGVLQLAAAGGIELAQAADIASNVLSQFGLEVAELDRVNDVLAATTSSTNTTIEGLARTLTYAGPIAAELGADVETVAAMAGRLGSAGIQATQAGTAMRAMFTRLAAPIGAAGVSLSALGVAVEDAGGTMRPMPDILADLEAALAGYGETERAAHLQAIFGTEAVGAAAILLGETSSGALGTLITELRAADGAAAEMAEAMSDNTAGALREVRSALESVAISIGSTLLPSLAEGAQAFAGIARAVAGFAEEHPELTRAIGLTVTGLIGLKLAAFSAGYAFTALSGPVLTAAHGLVRGAGLIGRGFALAARPLRLFGVAARAALIGSGIGLAIAAVAAGATWIHNNWDNVAAFFDGVGAGIAAALAPVRPALDPILEGLGAIWTWLGELLGPVEDSEGAFRSWGETVGGVIGGTIGGVIDIITGFVDWFGRAGLAEAFADVFGTIGETVLGAARVIGRTVEWLIGAIGAAIEWAGHFVGNVATTAGHMTDLGYLVPEAEQDSPEAHGFVRDHRGQYVHYDTGQPWSAYRREHGMEDSAGTAPSVEPPSGPSAAAPDTAPLDALQASVDALAGRPSRVEAPLTVNSQITVHAETAADPDAIAAAVDARLRRAIDDAEAQRRAALTDAATG